MNEILQPHLSKIRIPSPGDRIYKDECVYSFDTPESFNGLFLCLNTFLGFGRDFVEMHHKRTGNCVFLHLRKIKREVPVPDLGDGEQPKKITKLAIGIEGGFDVNSEVKQFEYEELNTLVILPGFQEVSLSDEQLDMHVASAVSAILAADSATKTEELIQLAGTWDGEKRLVSKHAETLQQQEPARKIPPKGWKCDECDKTDNLWLNLTDGTILCGRKYFDGTGGNNHALEHFKVANHPLAVKLGTITPNSADVYSYDEDDMVEDPQLTKHLAHFGINLNSMEKTDKSMLELEIDINQRIGEWSIITESGTNLVAAFGPGNTGLANLGNSCYLNSVVQMLFHIPELRDKYFPPDHIFANSPDDPTQDFNTQCAKLAFGLWSGRYSQEPETGPKELEGIKPVMFKNIVGKGHAEFSTKRQQDAQEFFLHLINMIERNNRFASSNESQTQCLSFQVEDRIECTASRKVKYTTRTEYLLPMPIPLDKSTNLKEFQAFEEQKKILEIAGQQPDKKDVVRANISLQSCFEAFAEPETIDDFFSAAINDKTIAKKVSRLKTFPDYLVLQLKKFALGDDWVPKKLDIEVDVPDVLDLTHLRGHGLQENEELLPEHNGGNEAVLGFSPSAMAADVVAAPVAFDSSVLTQLMEMGFTLDSCKRALYSTQNSGAEAAVGWLFEHNGDADFNDPFTLDQPQAAGVTGAAFVPDVDGLANLMSMGIPREHAIRGLKETNNSTERAVDWIFNHPDEIAGGAMETDEPETSAGGCSLSTDRPPVTFKDGSEKYKLVAFISHMGSSTMCGHYVCHIRKEEKWIIFNDNKVAVSEHPQKGLAYLYLYKRD